MNKKLEQQRLELEERRSAFEKEKAAFELVSKDMEEMRRNNTLDSNMREWVKSILYSNSMLFSVQVFSFGSNDYYSVDIKN